MPALLDTMPVVRANPNLSGRVFFAHALTPMQAWLILTLEMTATDSPIAQYISNSKLNPQN